MMKAFGIPNGVYWVDRPYGPGRLGYDDFDIDPKRLPHFAEMVQWLNGQGMQMMLWIAPFFQGQMEKRGARKGLHPGWPAAAARTTTRWRISPTRPPARSGRRASRSS